MKKSILALLTLTSLNTFALDVMASKTIEIKVTEKGYEPKLIEVPTGIPITLKITRVTDETCATEIKFKGKNSEYKLPLNETVSIELGKIKKGTLDFSCGMNMDKGKIIAK